MHLLVHLIPDICSSRYLYSIPFCLWICLFHPGWTNIMMCSVVSSSCLQCSPRARNNPNCLCKIRVTCSLNSVEKTMDFLRLVCIVIPKLQTNQEMQKWCFNWQWPRTSSLFITTAWLFVPTENFKQKINLGEVWIVFNCLVFSFFTWFKSSFVHL